uniref:Fanconi anemia putative n=1 Tax=Albugo laibachii Nc14 TaxID=890382 RepID=F0WSK6_9STRA|nr:Fanconi anemia putative [Albugo laibachii Nc14]|eukprot:CCA24332.1 Fanconi anemia putative [Albugo laibachii Nc14]
MIVRTDFLCYQLYINDVFAILWPNQDKLTRTVCGRSDERIHKTVFVQSLTELTSHLCNTTSDSITAAKDNSDETELNLSAKAIDEIDSYGITSFFDHLGTIWTSNTSSTANAFPFDYITIVQSLLYITKRENRQNTTRKRLHTLLVEHFLLMLHRDVLPPDLEEFVFLHAMIEICNVPFDSISNCIGLILFGIEFSPVLTTTDLAWTSDNVSSLMDIFFSLLHQMICDTTATIVMDISLRCQMCRVTDILDNVQALSSESKKDQDSDLTCSASTYFDILFTYFFHPTIKWPEGVVYHVLRGFRTNWILSHQQEWSLTYKIVQECSRHIENDEVVIRIERISSLLHHILLLCQSLRVIPCRVALVRLFWSLLKHASIVSPPTGKSSLHHQSEPSTREWNLVRMHVSMIFNNVESVMKQQVNHALVDVLYHEIEHSWEHSTVTYWLETLCLFLISQQTLSTERAFRLIADHAIKSKITSTQFKTSFRAMILDLIAFANLEKWDIINSIFVSLGFFLMETQVAWDILRNLTSSLQLNGAIHLAPFGIRIILSCFHYQVSSRSRILDTVFTNLIVYSGHVTAKHRSDTISKKKKSQILLVWIVYAFALLIDRQSMVLTVAESHRWLDIIPMLPLDVAVLYLRALCALARQEPRVEAHLILKLRKILYRKEERFRVIAMNGFCTLLDRAIQTIRHDVSTLSQLYSQHTTKASTSLSQTVASNQYENALPETSSIAEELFRQFCSYFKRALELQTIVRKALYENFVILFTGCSVLREPILKLLVEHFTASYYVSDEALLPPIQLEACVPEAAGNVYAEPVAHLFWAIWSCNKILYDTFISDSTVASQSADSELIALHQEIESMVSSVMDRMKRCELQHFDLNDSIPFATSKSSRCIVQNLKSVLMFCMNALLEKRVNFSEMMDASDESIWPAILHWMSLHRWAASKSNIPFKSKASKKDKSENLEVTEIPMKEEEIPPKCWITLKALQSFFRNVHIAWDKDERWIASTEHTQVVLFFLEKLEQVLLDDMNDVPDWKEHIDKRLETESKRVRKASILQISKDLLWLSVALCRQSQILIRSRTACLKKESVEEVAFRAFKKILAYWKQSELSVDITRLQVQEAFASSEVMASAPNSAVNPVFSVTECIRSLTELFKASMRQNVDINSNGLQLIQELEQLAAETPTAENHATLEASRLHISEWLECLLSCKEPLLSPERFKQVAETIFRRELLCTEDKPTASYSLRGLKFAKRLAMGLLLACKTDDTTHVLNAIGADGEENTCRLMPFQLEHQSSGNILALVTAIQSFVQQEIDVLEGHLKEQQQQMRREWSTSWKELDRECMEQIEEMLATHPINDIPMALASSRSYLPHRMFHIVTILVPFVLVDFNTAAISFKTLRLCRRVLKLLTTFIQLRVRSKVSALPPIIQQLFCVTGAQFSPALLEFIACIYEEAKENRDVSDTKKGKKRSVQVLKPRRAVPLQARLIPEVIFALEQFDTALIRLSRLCKGVDFSVWCRLRQSRDFHLNRDRIRACFGQDEPEPDFTCSRKRRHLNEFTSSVIDGENASPRDDTENTIELDAGSAREVEEELEKTQRQIELNDDTE